VKPFFLSSCEILLAKMHMRSDLQEEEKRNLICKDFLLAADVITK
jgi:hypothetical protein